MFRIKNNFHCYLVVFLLVTVQFHTIDCQQGALQKEFHRDVVSDLATFLFDCWNNFVPMMSTGIPNLKIPILDPWHSKTIPFQIQDSDLKASASFNSSSVDSVGLSDATMIPQQRNDLDNVIKLSHMTIRGKYDVSGSYHYLFPVYGYGSFEIQLHDVVGTMNITVNSSSKELIFVKAILDSFTYSTFSSSFDNLSGFGTDTATRSKFIVTMTRTLWPIIDEQIRNQLSISLTEYYNDRLHNSQAFSNTFVLVRTTKD